MCPQMAIDPHLYVLLCCCLWWMASLNLLLISEFSQDCQYLFQTLHGMNNGNHVGYGVTMSQDFLTLAIGELVRAAIIAWLLLAIITKRVSGRRHTQTATSLSRGTSWNDLLLIWPSFVGTVAIDIIVLVLLFYVWGMRCYWDPRSILNVTVFKGPKRRFTDIVVIFSIIDIISIQHTPFFLHIIIFSSSSFSLLSSSCNNKVKSLLAPKRTKFTNS